ncbi:hypothetical protein [Halobacterium sp. R2-5]|uniref:hypothetical protein n=1 Tax=Halobacterium sp. R2-5 TaxID=2715751 RepID=UPI00142065A8|nr:hypothetical protein [Halobacterium sp. R2-5]NIB98498.1 hypothetical protein [Halobacterium sp. R2-5]
MLQSVDEAVQRLDDVRPLVRPTYNEFEVRLLPPYGDPEVHIPGEFGTYVATGVVLGAAAELLDE